MRNLHTNHPILLITLALFGFLCIVDCTAPPAKSEKPSNDAATRETITQVDGTTTDNGQPNDQTTIPDPGQPDGTNQQDKASEPNVDRAPDKATTPDVTGPETRIEQTPEPTQEAVPEGCSQGKQSCLGACVDHQTDDNHCGACGKSCTGAKVCITGKCLIPSKLWGKSGEKFDPKGRLMDWSYAGYQHGEKALPTSKPNVRLTDFGAIANDKKDDTSAFEKALAAVAKGGTIRIPKGTFILQKRLRLNANVIIQGEGIGQTIVSIPKSLTDVYGNKGLSGGGTSSYSFGGAFFEVRGSSPNQSRYKLAGITGNASRGAKTVRVDDVAKLKAGQWVLMYQTDDNRTLMNHLHADVMKAGDDNVGDSWSATNQITQIKGQDVTFARAFPVDVKTRWKPTLYNLTALRSGIGIEKLTIRFPKTSYPGHFKERGYNAIDFHRAYNSWVREVRIDNADYGVNFRSSYHLTAKDVTLVSQRSSSLHGHHGLNIGHGGDHLLIGFHIDATYVHDVTVEWYSTGNVITKGKGRNMRMDHHRAAPYLTLWTEIDLGIGKQAFVSGGRRDRGPNTGAYSTFWHFVASNKVPLPAANYGPRMSFVGFPTSATKPSSPTWWLETMPAAQLGPKNLWEAMVQKRLGRPSPLR